MTKPTKRIFVTESNVIINELPIEMVERKGLGHPDTLSDGIAEEMSRQYSRYCMRNFGFIPHHNFDKVQIIAGLAHPRFGGGEILAPITVNVGGRGIATIGSESIPINEIVIESAFGYMKRTIRNFDERYLRTTPFVGQGSADLISIFERSKDIRLANDTSFGVAHYPLSILENLVLSTEKFVNPTLLTVMKELGEDVKVMGVRIKNNFSLTIGVPVIDRYVSDIREYQNIIRDFQDEIRDFAQGLIDGELTVETNAGDDIKNEKVYLSVIGTSAENGDDGMCGRGNRANGLITPYRPMSLEGVAGKNPISHIGKLYNVLAMNASKEIVEKAGAQEATVHILSKIGTPINQPLVSEISLIFPKHASTSERKSIEKNAENILEENLSRINEITNMILKGDISLF